MSKIAKNITLVFAGVCAIALIAFCVELIALNRNSGEDEDERTPLTESSGAADEHNSAGPQGSGEDSRPAGAGSQENTGQPSPGGASSSPRPAASPTGTRHQLLMPGEMELFLYADEAQFEYSELALQWMFEYAGEGAASLIIYLEYMPSGAGSIAVGCLDRYLGSGGTSIGSDEHIGASPLRGLRAFGDKDGEIYEAWIHNFSAADVDDMGVIFTIHYRTDEQKEALYSILDSMSLVAMR